MVPSNAPHSARSSFKVDLRNNKHIDKPKIQRNGKIKESFEKLPVDYKRMILIAFGEVFTRNVKMYVYPAMQEGSEELMTCKNIPIPEGIKFLFQHLIDSGQVCDITGFKGETLYIFSKEVLKMIKIDESGWEEMVPAKVAALIKEPKFGYIIRLPNNQISWLY